MANVNAPFGARPVGSFTGAPYMGRVTRYLVPSGDNNAYYEGDLVLSTNNADANGVPAMIKATVGTETCRGIIVGFEQANTVQPPGAVPSLGGIGASIFPTQVSIPATKGQDYYILVADDPNIIFFMQGDLTATNQVATKSNNNATVTIAAPGTATFPISASVINSANIATTNTLNIKLMGLAQIPGNGFGAFATWVCMFNLHELSGAGTSGV